MAPGRNDRAAPPAPPGGYEVRFVSNDAAKGWEDLAHQAPGNLWTAWEILSRAPASPTSPKRHHKLRGDLATIKIQNSTFNQWQYEVTGAGRIWFFVNEEKRAVWITHAATSHPKKTDK